MTDPDLTKLGGPDRKPGDPVRCLCRVAGEQQDEPPETSALTEDQRRTFAGVHLMRYFMECVKANAEDREPPSPEDLPPPEGEGELDSLWTGAAAILTGHPGWQYERRTLQVFEALADMLAARGAELEGMMHEIIHDEPRQAMVIRMKVPGAAP
jgi:hypothetical protein